MFHSVFKEVSNHLCPPLSSGRPHGRVRHLMGDVSAVCHPGKLSHSGLCSAHTARTEQGALDEEFGDQHLVN